MGRDLFVIRPKFWVTSVEEQSSGMWLEETSPIQQLLGVHFSIGDCLVPMLGKI
jgi:hypothetical protein